MSEESVCSLGKCGVKGCTNEATAASIALTQDGLAQPVLVCEMHRRIGEKNYTEKYGTPKAGPGRKKRT